MYFLVIADKHNPNALLVSDELNYRNHRVIRIDNDSLSKGMRFKLDIDSSINDIHFTIDNEQFHSKDISGVLAYPLHFTNSGLQDNEKDKNYVSAEQQAALLSIINAFNCPVINRYNSSLWYQNFNCMYNSSYLFSDAGFKVPRTIVTTKYEEIEKFSVTAEGEVVYYPISGHSFYKIDSPTEREKLKKLLVYFPVRLVELTDGEIAHFIVIDNIVHLKTNVGKYESMSKDLRSQLVNINRRMGITVSDFTLARTGNGEWYGININPYPDWSSCEEKLRITITKQIADLLEDK